MIQMRCVDNGVGVFSTQNATFSLLPSTQDAAALHKLLKFLIGTLLHNLYWDIVA
jgi:hypothetical protein